MKMLMFFFEVLVLMSMSSYTLCQTIYSYIESRDDLSQLHAYMNQDYIPGNTNGHRLDIVALLERIGGLDNYVFFAPNNDAFNALDNKADISLNRWNRIFMRHMMSVPHDMPGLISRDSWEDQVKRAADSISYLFFRNFRNKYYVNGAQLVGNEVECQNGMLHIVDRVFVETMNSTNALQYVEEGKSRYHRNVMYSIRRFREFVTVSSPSSDEKMALTVSSTNFPRGMTLFIPVDSSFSSDTWADIYNDLRNKETELSKVLRSHIICCSLSSVYYTSQLRDLASSDGEQVVITDGITSDRTPKGRISVRITGDTVFINNRCSARIIVPDVMIGNGVIHYIDNLLGYTHSSAYDFIESQNDLDTLGDYIELVADSAVSSIKAPQGSNVPQDQLVTMFAAHNEAFFGLDIAQNLDTLGKLIKMQIVEGVYDSVQLALGGSAPTKATMPGSTAKYEARFYEQDGELYVEVNHVRGRVIKRDVCVLTGLVHIIDVFLGYPRHTLMSTLDDTMELRDFRYLIVSSGMMGYFNTQGSKRTVFAPTNEAIVNMRLTDIGQQILNSRSLLAGLLERHIVDGEVFVPSEENVVRQVPSRAFSLVRRNQGDYVTYGSVDMRIKHSNLRMTDGVVHILDSVIFADAPRELQALVSHAPLPPTYVVNWHTVCTVVICMCWLIVGKVCINI